MADQAEGEKGEQKERSTHPKGQNIQIRIKGQLSSDWADWLDGLEMTCQKNGEMILSGSLADQAALMGVLVKLHRLNLTILSVNGIDRNEIRG